MNLPIENTVREIIRQELEPLKNLISQMVIGGEKHPKKKLLDTNEAAEYLGKSPSWVSKKRSKGGGPVYLTIGGNVKYSVEDLEAFKLEQRRKHTSDLGPSHDREY